MGRLFGFLSLVLGLAVGMYFYTRQMQDTSAAAGIWKLQEHGGAKELRCHGFCMVDRTPENCRDDSDLGFRLGNVRLASRIDRNYPASRQWARWS